MLLDLNFLGGRGPSPNITSAGTGLQLLLELGTFSALIFLINAKTSLGEHGSERSADANSSSGSKE